MLAKETWLRGIAGTTGESRCCSSLISTSWKRRGRIGLSIRSNSPKKMVISTGGELRTIKQWPQYGSRPLFVCGGGTTNTNRACYFSVQTQKEEDDTKDGKGVDKKNTDCTAR